MFFAMLIFCLVVETLGKVVLTGVAVPIALAEMLAETVSELF